MTGIAQAWDRQRWYNLIGATACVTVFAVGLGVSFPLLTLVLERQGVEAWLIGLNAGFGPLGVVVAGPLIPMLVARYGSQWVARVSVVVVALLFLSFKLVPDLWIWFSLRFMLGMAAGMLFALSESWVIRSAEGPSRGRITAIYASILSGGFALGPALLTVIGSEGWAPFLASCAIMLTALVPLAFIGMDDRAAAGHEPVSFLSFLPRAPILLAAVGVFALLDTATLGLLPLYGLRKGLDTETAVLALTVMIGGNVALQYPIGWIGDRLPRRAVMLACAFVTATACLLLPTAMGHPFMWPLLAVIGAAGFGLYTLAMSILGDRFKGAALVAGASAFAAMWGFGGIVGPPAAGWSMQHFGPDGLPYGLAAVFFSFAAAMLVRDTIGARRGPDS